MLKLLPGEYLVSPVRSRRVTDLTLSVTTYPPGQSYPWHVHENPTLFILLAARHRDETRHGSFDQPVLSAVFHPATSPHATVSGPDGLVGINLEWTDPWLDRCHLRPANLGIECQLLGSLWARLLGLRLAAAVDGTAADADVETAALELVAGLVHGPAPTSQPPRWMSRATEYLVVHANSPIRLRNVAAEVGVHPVYFARAFRRATGRTVSAYIQALRLVDAGRRILDEGQPLAEAALAAGFADQAHFTRTCSHTLGFTPIRLRRVRQALVVGRPGSIRSRMSQVRPVDSGE